MTQLATKKREVLKRYGDIGEGWNRKRILKALESCEMGADSVFDKIFKFTQTQTMDSDDSKNYHLEAVSRWIFTSLVNVYEKKNEANAAARLYSRLSEIPWAGVIWGLLIVQHRETGHEAN